MANSGRPPRVLIGVTGSVAAVKLPELAAKLEAIADVRIATTAAARHFFNETDLPASTVPMLGDEHDWRNWQQVGDEVLHIELRRWADLLVIAPLSANSLAKLAGGLCDNLLTCVVRAWDFHRPLLVAPAMNTLMWDSRFTEQHLQVLRDLGMTIVPPIAKRLACGDTGMGAMAAPDTIVAAVEESLRTMECSYAAATEALQVRDG